jgi:N-methylhydantoinase A
VNLRTVHRSGGLQSINHPDGPEQVSLYRKGERRVLFAGSGASVSAAIYDRAALEPQSIIKGPAIVEQSDTTVLIEPGWQAHRVVCGTLLLSPV